MGNTDDLEHDAKWKGYTQGLYGELETINPYKAGTGTWAAWDAGWQAGHKGSERMKTRKVRAI